jgi:hypothetical protein
LTNGSPTGTETTLTIAGNVVHVTVSESPLLISVDNMDGAIPSKASASARASTEDTSKKILSEESESFRVYPNPSKGYINITVKGKPSGVVRIFDLAGREQLQQKIEQNQTQLDVHALRKGMYLLKFNNGKESTTSKILIE